MTGVPASPVRLAEGLYRIPTLGKNAINSFAFVEDGGTVTLVDAGLKGAPKRLATALSEIGRRPTDVTKILLTHAHFDHVGGAAGLRTRTGAPVHIHDDDAGFLRAGRRPPLDPTRPLAKVAALMGSKLPSCPVDETFVEGDLIAVGGGLRVLHTPGHTPGHCSFLHERSGVLITGDSIFNFRNKMAWSFATFCSNFQLSKDTAERLGEVDYETAAFTHGPEIRGDARAAVRAFLRARQDR